MSVGYKLQDKIVSLDQLFLDPGNYRLDRGSDRNKLIDTEVINGQENVFEKLSREKLGDLKKSIIENGFLEVDRIVVRKLAVENEMENYLVIEGNRRAAAFKSLIKDYENGLVDLEDDLVNKSSNINVVLVDGSLEDIDKYVNAIMGIRHVSGPKKWTGMQSAKLVNELFETQSLTPAQIGAMLGISAQETNRRRRAYLAYQQLEKSKEYGHLADPDKHYALLAEFTGKRILLDWFNWADEEGIKNQKAQEVVYRHITSVEGKAEIHNPTLAREFIRALSIGMHKERLENNPVLMFSDLGPISTNPEDIVKEFKEFLGVLCSIGGSGLPDSVQEYKQKILDKLREL